MKTFLLASVLALSCMTASAGVVKFDGHDNTIFGDEDGSNGIASVSIDGYTFSNAGDHFHLVDMAQFGMPSDGTSSLLSDRSTMLTMTKTDGKSFDLRSLLAYSSYSSTLWITGYFVDGGSISSSFSVNVDGFSLLALAGFDGLSRVTFVGSPDTPFEPSGFGVENIVLRDGGTGLPVPVPEPLTGSLVALALAGVGLSRRRSLKTVREQV